MLRQLKKGFDWFKVKKVRFIDIIVVTLLLISYVVCSLFGFNIKLDFNFDIDIEAGYFAILDKTGGLYVVDRGQERLFKVYDNKVVWEIENNKEHKLGQIENVVIGDNGNIYIHELQWDESGFLLEGENICEYGPDGKYIQNIYSLNYFEDNKKDKPTLFNLRFVDGNIECLKLDDCGFEIVKIANMEEAVLKSRYTFDDALTFIQSIVVSPNTNNIYIVDKRGKILCANEQGISIYYNFKDKAAPYDIVVGSDESIYFTDLYSQSVGRISSNKEVKETFGKQDVFKDQKMDGNQGLISNVSVKSVMLEDGREQDVVIAMFDGTVIYAVTQDGELIYNQSSFEPSYKLLIVRLIACISPLIFIFCAMLLIVRLIFIVVCNKKKMKVLFLVEIIIILTTIVVLSVILPSVTTSISDTYIDGVSNQLLSMSDMASNIITAENVSNINNPSDFMNSNYKDTIKKLQLVTFSNDNSDRLRMSGRIEKSIDDVFVSVAYQNVRRGSYTPLTHADKEDIMRVYRTKQSEVQQIISETGQYVLARSPILNFKGDVVACVCIAKDVELLRKTVSSLIERIVINLLSLIVLGVFIVNEVIAFLAEKKEYTKNKQDENSLSERKPIFPCHILRLSNAIFSMSLNMSAVFLPVYILSFYSEKLGISRMLAGTIPLSINTAFILVASSVSLNIFEKFGFKKVIIFAVCCSMFSDIALAIANSYYIMAIALIFNGLGYGLLIESKRSYLASLAYQERSLIEIFCASGEGSGQFFGLFIGGFLAAILSYNQVFWMSVLTDIVALVFCIYFCKTYIGTGLRGVDNSKSKMGILNLLLSKGVLPYLIVMPIIWGILIGFAGYYIPIFGSVNNFYENQISLSLALVSFCFVFFASAMTKFAIKKWNKNAIYVAILIALFAILLLVGFNDKGVNMGMCFMSLLLLGIAYGFGSGVCRYKFLTMDKVKEFGENGAQSVYNFFLGAGMVASSLLFGWMLSNDIVSSMWKFSIVCFVLMAIYKIFFDRKTKNN